MGKNQVLNVECSKKAVLIGVNYPGKRDELQGCINDVMRMKECLIKTCEFLEKDITILIDTDPSYTQPTRENIWSALSSLVDSAKPGDILFVHFSGHGNRTPSKSEDDDTGYDEFIVANDRKTITDDDFRALVNRVPIGCTLTILSDSCRSGGLIEGAKEQIGKSTLKRQNLRVGFDLNDDVPFEEGYTVVNYRSVPTFPQFDDVIGSPKEKFELDQTQLKGRGIVLIRMKHSLQSIFEPSESGPPDRGILLSACQSHQEAAEVTVPGSNKLYGAFCDSIVGIIEETQGKVTYRDLVLKAGKKLQGRGIIQEPGLYCSDELANHHFLS